MTSQIKSPIIQNVSFSHSFVFRGLKIHVSCKVVRPTSNFNIGFEFN